MLHLIQNVFVLGLLILAASSAWVFGLGVFPACFRPVRDHRDDGNIFAPLTWLVPACLALEFGAGFGLWWWLS